MQPNTPPNSKRNSKLWEERKEKRAPLRELFKRHPRSFKQAAELANLGLPRVTNWFEGEGSPRVEAAVKVVAHHLRCKEWRARNKEKKKESRQAA